MKINKLFLLVLVLINFHSYGKEVGNDSSSLPLNRVKPQRHLLIKGTPRFRIDTAYAIPFLTIQLGAGIAMTDGKIQLNSENSDGSRIDLENDLGYSTSQVIPRFNFYLNFTRKHHILFDLFTIRRKETAILPRDIQYGNAVFHANTSVDSKFHSNQYHLAYKYSFISRPHYDLGILGGLSVLDFALRVEDASIMRREGLFLPVPLLGLDGFVFLTKRIYLRGTAKIFMAQRSNLDYTLFSFKPYIEYYFTDNVGIGLRYLYTYSSVDKIATKAFDGNFKYQFNAISVFACFRFFKK